MMTRSTIRGVAAALGVGSALLAGACREETPETPATAPAPAGGGAPAAEAAGSAATPGANPLFNDGGAAATDEAGTRLVVSGVAMVVPDTWRRAEPANSMRAAQYELPAPGADGAPEFVVFRGIRGGTQANIDRWIGQMSDVTAGPTTETFEADTGLTVTSLEIAGSLTVGSFMGGTGEPAPGQVMLAAVIEGSADGPLHLKITGPASVIDAQTDAWRAMLRSIERAG